MLQRLMNHLEVRIDKNEFRIIFPKALLIVRGERVIDWEVGLGEIIFLDEKIFVHHYIRNG